MSPSLTCIGRIRALWSTRWILTILICKWAINTSSYLIRLIKRGPGDFDLCCFTSGSPVECFLNIKAALTQWRVLRLPRLVSQTLLYQKPMERQSGLFLLHLFSWPHFHLFMHTFSGCVIFHLLVLIFICSCIIYVFFVQFLFVAAYFFCSLLVFSLSMLRIICLVPFFVRRAVFCSAC